MLQGDVYVTGNSNQTFNLQVYVIPFVLKGGKTRRNEISNI